jgi:uncharacterized membrane protein (DUF2068 family)
VIAKVHGKQPPRAKGSIHVAVNGLIDAQDAGGLDVDEITEQTASDQALCRSVVNLVLFDATDGQFSVLDGLPGRSLALYAIVVIESYAPWVLNSYTALTAFSACLAKESGVALPAAMTYLHPSLAELVLYASRVGIIRP